MNKPVSWQAGHSIPPTPLPTPGAIKLTASCAGIAAMPVRIAAELRRGERAKPMKQTLEDKMEAVLDDPVNHPSHYTDGIETIDYIESKHFPYHIGNAVKYLPRAGKKNPAETITDLRKAVWYINR